MVASVYVSRPTGNSCVTAELLMGESQSTCPQWVAKVWQVWQAWITEDTELQGSHI